MNKSIPSIVAALAATAAIASPPPPATALLGKAEAAARAEHKNVLLIFHASW